MKTVADLQPGDIVNISDQPFTVKPVYTSGGSTTLVFEDVPATQERCDALKGLARDTGGIAAMVPVRPMQKQSWERSELKRWLNEQVRDDAEEMRRYLDEQHQPESGSGGTNHEGRS